MEKVVQYDDGTKIWNVQVSNTSRSVDIYTCILKECCLLVEMEHFMKPLMLCEDGIYRQKPNPTLEDMKEWTAFLCTSSDRRINSTATFYLTMVSMLNIGIKYIVDKYTYSTTISVFNDREIVVNHLSPISMIDVMYRGALLYSNDFRDRLWFMLHPPTVSDENAITLTHDFDNAIFCAWIKDLYTHSYEDATSDLSKRLLKLKNVQIQHGLDGDALLSRTLIDL